MPIAALSATFDAMPNLYRRRPPSLSGGLPRRYPAGKPLAGYFVGDLPAHQMRIMDYNRWYATRDDTPDFLARWEAFLSTPADGGSRVPGWSACTAGRWYRSKSIQS
jgi:hypothetical protein